MGERLRKVGNAAFADCRVFTDEGIKAQPSVDVLGVAFTWLAIMHGMTNVSCQAPWSVEGRDDWLEHKSRRAPDVKFLSQSVISHLTTTRDGPDKVAMGLYEFVNNIPAPRI